MIKKHLLAKRNSNSMKMSLEESKVVLLVDACFLVGRFA